MAHFRDSMQHAMVAARPDGPFIQGAVMFYAYARRAVVALNAATPDRWLVIPAGSDVEEAARLLGLPLD